MMYDPIHFFFSPPAMLAGSSCHGSDVCDVDAVLYHVW